MTRIVTHSGVFHADEIFAIALLNKFYLKLPAEILRKFIVRTRYVDTINEAKNNKTIFVLDVGGEHSIEHLNFDHHQTGTGDDESTCRMIFDWLIEKEVFINEHPLFVRGIRENVVQPISMHDNGLMNFYLSEVISGYNRDASDANNQDKQFHLALSFAMQILDNTVYQIKVAIKREKILMRGLEDHCYRNFLMLPEFVFGASKYLGDMNIPQQYFAYTNPEGGINLQVIEGNDRALFPINWRGLSGEELVKVSGLDNALFCHKGGHLLVFDGKVKIEKLNVVANMVGDK